MAYRDILVRAKNRIADPAHWCQHTWARDAEGRNLGNLDWDPPGAVSWCALAAILIEGRNDPDADNAGPIRQTVGYFGGDVTLFNNTHSHAEVMAAFDGAIEAVGAKP